jgi:hypothetical protein
MFSESRGRGFLLGGVEMSQLARIIQREKRAETCHLWLNFVPFFFRHGFDLILHDG